MRPKLFLISFILISVAVAGGNPILDANGDELLAGTPYYISPIGLGLPPNISTRCPVGIILTKTATLPVTLWPVDDPNQTIIHTSTKLHIKFPTFQTGCMDHNLLWQVGFDGGIGLSFVLLGEPANEFEVVEDEKSGGYSFATRMSGSLYKIGALRDVWDLNTWLFINNVNFDAPFPVVFSKAPQSSISNA